MVCGVPLPAGLRNASRLPEPIFTPATKAEMGEHDENISFDQMCRIVGTRARRPGSGLCHPPLHRGRRPCSAARHHHCR